MPYPNQGWLGQDNIKQCLAWDLNLGVGNCGPWCYVYDQYYQVYGNLAPVKWDIRILTVDFNVHAVGVPLCCVTASWWEHCWKNMWNNISAVLLYIFITSCGHMLSTKSVFSSSLYSFYCLYVDCYHWYHPHLLTHSRAECSLYSRWINRHLDLNAFRRCLCMPAV